jgi:hypothetical protein
MSILELAVRVPKKITLLTFTDRHPLLTVTHRSRYSSLLTVNRRYSPSQVAVDNGDGE